MGGLPGRTARAAAGGLPARDQIKLLDFDPAKALAEDEANKMKFADIFSG